jgi:hypothetical protein
MDTKGTPMRPSIVPSIRLFRPDPTKDGGMDSAKPTPSDRARKPRRADVAARRFAANLERGIYRRKLGINHFEKLGIPRKDMTRYLHGDVLPNVERLIVLAGELGVKSHRLLLDEDLFLDHVLEDRSHAPALEPWLLEAVSELQRVADPATALAVLRALPKRSSAAVG